MDHSTLDKFFNADYMPHGHCYLWNPTILWTNVISDVFIALAYFSIPFALYYFVKKRADLQFKGLFVLFSLFIALCGITHLISIIVIWKGIYGVLGVAKALTAIVSVITAIQAVRILPLALKLPSPSDLEHAMQSAANEKIRRVEVEYQQRRDEVLRESTEAVYVGVIVTDDNGQILIANEATCNIFGYTKAEMEGNSINMLVDKEIARHHQDLIKRFTASAEKLKHMASGRIVTGLAKDGREIPVEVVLNQRNSNGQELIYVSVLDLSERIAHQEKLLETNSRFERITSGAEEALWELNLSNNTLWFSTRLGELVENKNFANDVSGEDWFNIIHPDYQPAVEKFFNSTDTEKGPKYIEFLAKKGTGIYNWFAARAGFTCDINGVPLFRSGTVFDIQENKTLERQLSEQHDYFRSVFEGAGNAIFSIIYRGNDEFYIENINRVAMDTMGSVWENAIGKSVDDIVPKVIPAETAEAIKANYRHVVENKAPYEYIEMIPAGDQEFWWKTKLFPQIDQSGELVRIVGSASDITELIQAQRSLESKEQFITRAFNSASLMGVYVYNKLTGKNEFINDSYTRITGYTLDQINGMTQEEFMDHFHEDEREKVLSHMAHLFSSKDDEDVEQLEYRFKRSDNSWVWCLSQDAVFDRDEQGNVVSFIGSFLDITSFKEMQFNLLELKDQAEAASQAKTDFLANMSHEIRTPMNAILGLVQMLLQMKLEGRQKTFVQKIHSSSKFLLNVLNDILDYSKIEAGKLDIQQEPFSVYKLIADTVGLFTLAAEEKGLEINYDVSKLKHKYYLGDALRVGQILNNLVGNAIKFTESGSILLKFWSDEINHKSFLIFSVTDTGIGISEENVEKLFKSFSQADTSINRKYGGTGLGLSIIKGLLDRMAGDITLQSVDGVGSKFSVKIPLTPSDQLEDKSIENGISEDENFQLEGNLNGAHILLVEDNPTNQLLAKSFLQSKGAIVKTAENGKQAWEMSKSAWFDIVLMDLQMPEMDGFESARHIRTDSLRTDVPIIAMSAAVTESDVERVYSTTMNDHIPKPIDLQEALKVISKWTNRKTAISQQEPGEALTIIPNGIDETIINIKPAVIKMNREWDLYLAFVKSYLTDRENMIEEVQQFYDRKEYVLLERFMHTIKGLAASLGANSFSSLSRRLELAAKDQRITKEDITDFTNMASEVKNELEKLVKAEIPKQSPTNTRNLTKEEETILNKLKEKISAGQFVSEEEVQGLEEMLTPVLDHNLLKELLRSIRLLDYSKANNLLEEIKPAN